MRLKRNYGDGRLKFEYYINVTKQGIFTAYLPEEIIEKLEAAGIQMNYGIGSKKGYFEANSLVEIEKNITEKIKKFSERKQIDERIVLKYAITTTCSYCKLKTGEIVPNGNWQKEIEDDYNWLSGNVEHNANNPAPYGLSIYVEPFKCITWQFPDKTEHKEYNRLCESDYEKGSTLDWLDSLCGINNGRNDEVKEIDYTEKLGEFFKSAILFICNMNEKLKGVFGEELEVTLEALSSFPKLENKR